MPSYHVNYSKSAQIKIQQMAFVLVALVIFGAIATIFYLSISLSNLRGTASELEDQRAKELVRALSSIPELEFTSGDCSNCIDFDKVLILKERKAYSEFFELDFLQIEKVFPDYQGECTKSNYPNCKTVTLINKNVGSPQTAFVSICHWTAENGGYSKCEIGRIYASGKAIE